MKYRLLLFLCLISVNAHLQTKLNWGFEIKPKFGFLVAKRGVVGHLPQSHTYGGEASFVVHTNGSKKWHRSYNYPTIGLTVFSASVGNNEILGIFTGSYGFIEFPFAKTDSYKLTGKIGGGMAYGSKIYDPVSNPKNTVISSHLNALVCFGLQNRFVFNHHELVLGVDLTHCSNGCFKLPNIGINMPFVSVGYGYRMKTTDVEKIEKEILPYKRILYGVFATYSGKEVYPTGQGRSPIYGISVFSRCFFKPKAGFELSLDIVSKQVLLQKYQPDLEKDQIDIIQVGLYAGYLLPLDRFHFVLGMGVNIRDKYQPESLLYHRIGARYYFDNGIHLNAVLRSNWAVADFTEWGIGYTFNYRRND